MTGLDSGLPTSVWTRLPQTRLWTILAETHAIWRADRVPRLGAGLAYYGLFALVPLLAIALAIAGLLFETQQVSEALGLRLAEILGEEVDTAAIVARAASFVDEGETQAGFGVAGVLSMLVGGSVFFLAYQDALNVIFHEPARVGVEFTFRRRFRASLVVLLTGTVIASTLVVQALLAFMNTLLPDLIDGPELLSGSVGIVISTVLGALLLTVLVRALVYEPIGWRPALVAQSVTALCLAAGAFGFGVYVDRVATQSLAGANTGVLITIVFIYVEAQILLAGGALTKTLNSRRVAVATETTRPSPEDPSPERGHV
ncbi:MAG: YihY/virulence factor BrkB family protein [Acidimicrobiia bacterium]|nr:YihY/virulence factor BrkB family protein [Acidimicrobiia bacterium]